MLNTPAGWTGIAFNQIPRSDNLIHSDDIAREYGFTGALVPGVTLTAYLAQPAIEAWGLAWLNRGEISARIVKPVYDEARFSVEIIESAEASAHEARLISQGELCAEASISLPASSAEPPRYRGCAMITSLGETLPATRTTMEGLMRSGCRAQSFNWSADHEMASYLRDQTEMPSLLRTDTERNGKGYANLAFLLGCANRHFSSLAHMTPWIHLQTTSRNFQAVPLNTELVSELEILDLFEKKGHEFADVRVNLFRQDNKRCVCQIDQRAIYQLRRA